MSQLSLAALPLLRSCRHTGRLINVVISRGLALSARLQKNQGMGTMRRDIGCLPTLTLAGVPSFTKASSPELDEILQEFRSKIILPLYLNKKQRQLIFKRKYASQLENDPVTATIGDEEFRLEPLDVLKDIPGTAQELGKILALTKDHNDWLNWLPILEGLGRRKKTPDKWRNRFIRSAILAGESEVVISALRRVKRTRLHLSSPSLRGIVFRGLRNLAQQHGWSQDALEQALRRVKEVINLMEDEAHCGNRRVDTRDPRAEPLTLGTLAELAARRSAIEGDDQEGYKAFAVDYGERLVLALEQQDTDLVGHHEYSLPILAHRQAEDFEEWRELRGNCGKQTHRAGKEERGILLALLPENGRMDPGVACASSHARSRVVFLGFNFCSYSRTYGCCR